MSRCGVWRCGVCRCGVCRCGVDWLDSVISVSSSTCLSLQLVPGWTAWLCVFTWAGVFLCRGWRTTRMESVRRFVGQVMRRKTLNFEQVLRCREVPRYKSLLHLLVQGTVIRSLWLITRRRNTFPHGKSQWILITPECFLFVLHKAFGENL